MNSLIITCINNIPILGKHASIQTSSQNCLLAYLFTDHCLLACVSTNTQAACVMLAYRTPWCRDSDEVKVSADSASQPKPLGGADHHRGQKTRKTSRRDGWYTSPHMALKQPQQ
jgi:hypothetical protein